MQFLRTIFWVALAVIFVIFAVYNGQRTEIRAWDAFVVEAPLWLIVLGSFLIGLLPVLVLHRATRWNLNRKLDSANRNLAETRAVVEPVRVDPAPPGML
jgi:lipopolysaccharide assembly protein A